MKLNNHRYSAVQRLYPYLLANRKLLVCGTIFSLLAAAVNFPLPLLTKYIIDDVVNSANINKLNLIVLLMIFIYIFKSIFSYSISLVTKKVKEHILKNMRSDLVKKMLHVEFMTHKQINKGYLATRIIKDPEMASGVLGESIISIVISIITFIFGMIALLHINYELTLVSLSVFPFVLIVQYYNSIIIRKYTKDIMELGAILNGTLTNILMGIYTIKAYSAEKHFISKTDNAIDACYKRKMEFINIQAVASSIGAFITSIGPMVILYFGIRKVLSGSITLGEYFAFSGYMAYIYVPVQSLFSTNINIQGSISALDRINEIFEMQTENTNNKSDNERNEYFQDCPGEGISFENVGYTYCNSGFQISDCSFKIPFGKHVAIVGRSGSGKTTIVNMILKYLVPDKGTISIGGIGLNNIDNYYIRENISYIPQEVFLFLDTIYNNLSFIKGVDDDKEIRDALAAVGLINNSENDEEYISVMQRNSINISGGEKQRIAVVRALLKKSNIVIMDEATSDLDPISEKLVYDALATKRTTIVDITHSQSGIARSDKVVFIDNGEVISSGKHEDIMEESLKYRTYFNTCKL